jgi:hypothetical protein
LKEFKTVDNFLFDTKKVHIAERINDISEINFETDSDDLYSISDVMYIPIEALENKIFMLDTEHDKNQNLERRYV